MRLMNYLVQVEKVCRFVEITHQLHLLIGHNHLSMKIVIFKYIISFNIVFLCVRVCLCMCMCMSDFSVYRGPVSGVYIVPVGSPCRIMRIL